MNLIQYASKKERVHVEQIIREQPVLKDADNVTIKTISVRKSLGLTMDVFAPAAVSDEPLPVLALKVGDTVELFGQNGTVTFDGIVFQNGVPWEAIKDKVWQLYKSSPCLVNKTNFLSFIETIMNFCDDIEGTKLPFVKKINNKEVTHDDKKAC